MSLRNKEEIPCASHSPPDSSPRSLLGACQVSKDDDNGTTSVTYNSDVAENAAADIGNTAQNIAADIGNDVQKTGDKIENKVGNTDVNVKSTRRARQHGRHATENKASNVGSRSVSGGWSGRQDSNLRPSAPKADALPDCATPRRPPLGLIARLANPRFGSASDGGPGRIRTSNLAVMSGRLYR